MSYQHPEIIASADPAALRQIIDEKMKDLPTLPIVVAKILQTASSPSASARELQALIAVDGGLTAKVLRLANSSYYGHARRITTLSEAVVVLGFSTVRNLTLSSSMLDALAPKGAAQVFDWRAYWEHCACVAACAKRIARRKNLGERVGEEAFIAGLLHDIGKLFLGKYCPDLLAEVLLTAEAYGIAMAEAEWRLMGTTHALLGQMIAEQWSFPPALASAIGAHHDPDAWKDDKTLTFLIHAANHLVQEAQVGAVDPVTLELHPEVLDWLEMSTVEREDLILSLPEEMERAKALLDWEASVADAATDETRPTSPPLIVPEADPSRVDDRIETLVRERSLAIAAASTVARVREELESAAEALLPVWGSVLFLWDDALGRFVSPTGKNPQQELLRRIGDLQIKESLLDRALASAGAQPLQPIPIATPQALQQMAANRRFLLVPLSSSRKMGGFVLLGLTALGTATVGTAAVGATNVGVEEKTLPEDEEARRGEKLMLLAGHAAAAAQRIQSFRMSVVALATAIDARDPLAEEHSRRVRDLAIACGRQLQLCEERLELLDVSALLHDVGKLGIPDYILNKPGRLEPQEYDNIVAHAHTGAHLAGHTFSEVIPFILCHHERFDGTGYPAGLQGTQIPLEAQIISVCEAWDVMRHGRIYRKALNLMEAQAELINNAGTQFNPEIVRAFVSLIPGKENPPQKQSLALNRAA